MQKQAPVEVKVGIVDLLVLVKVNQPLLQAAHEHFGTSQAVEILMGRQPVSVDRRPAELVAAALRF